MDGIRPRAFCPDRYVASSALGGLLANLHRNRLYLTPSDRNYGTYNNATTILANGTAYTAFFTLKPHKGRFDGIRHKLRLYVETRGEAIYRFGRRNFTCRTRIRKSAGGAGLTPIEPGLQG